MNTLFLKKVDGLVGSALARLLPPPVPPESDSPDISRLLLIRPGGIGDAVLLAPAIRQLRRTYPEAIIHVLAESRNAAVFGLCPEVDGVFRYDRPKELLAALGGRYDAILDTEQWHHLSAIIARFIRSSVKIGFATNGRKKLFNHPVPYAHETYEVDSFFHLLRPLGIAPSEVKEIPFLQVTPSAGKRAGELLSEISGRPFVALFPGASIPERRWGAEKFRAVAAALSERGIASVIVGGKGDVGDGAAIAEGGKILNLAGRTSLIETAAVLEKCAVLVSGDSGILHVAVGLGRPTVSLFGPGIAAKWAPRGQEHIPLNKKRYIW